MSSSFHVTARYGQSRPEIGEAPQFGVRVEVVGITCSGF